MSLLYFAPMEGLTTLAYRRLHHEMFGGVDKYFTPFLTPLKQDKRIPFAFKKRDLQSVLPENNEDIPLVPQVLCNRADAFLFAAKELSALGYKEINLNLGCPMATVVTKHKGAGFLEDAERLDEFFDEIFQELDSNLAVSVKTRIGLRREEEADALMEVFNRYPIAELIIHARLREDFYEGTPRRETFEKMLSCSVNPVGYNGDVYSMRDYDEIIKNATDCSILRSIMMGRGLLTNPALAREIRGGAPLEKEELRTFMDRLYEETARTIPEENNILHRMKGIWVYAGQLFQGSERALLNLKKARTKIDYDNAVREIFRECALRSS